MVEAEKEQMSSLKWLKVVLLFQKIIWWINATTLFRVLPDKDGVRKTSNYFLKYFRVL